MFGTPLIVSGIYNAAVMPLNIGITIGITQWRCGSTLASPMAMWLNIGITNGITNSGAFRYTGLDLTVFQVEESCDVPTKRKLMDGL